MSTAPPPRPGCPPALSPTPDGSCLPLPRAVSVSGQWQPEWGRSGVPAPPCAVLGGGLGGAGGTRHMLRGPARLPPLPPPSGLPAVPLGGGGAGVVGGPALGAARHRLQRDLVRHPRRPPAPPPSARRQHYTSRAPHDDDKGEGRALPDAAEIPTLHAGPPPRRQTGTPEDPPRLLGGAEEGRIQRRHPGRPEERAAPEVPRPRQSLPPPPPPAPLSGSSWGGREGGFWGLRPGQPPPPPRPSGRPPPLGPKQRDD